VLISTQGVTLALAHTHVHTEFRYKTRFSLSLTLKILTQHTILTGERGFPRREREAAGLHPPPTLLSLCLVSLSLRSLSHMPPRPHARDIRRTRTCGDIPQEEEGVSVYLYGEGVSVYLHEEGVSMYLYGEGVSMYLYGEGVSMYLYGEGVSMYLWMRAYLCICMERAYLCICG
jgi:hypothetical protein